ncbi:hypothetical protein CPB85DRAFT_5124 [Mucidula mucida]|nr:hypothetical protein CPB85DRAFT_5124 [Mucidula mucida]
MTTDMSFLGGHRPRAAAIAGSANGGRKVIVATTGNVSASSLTDEIAGISTSGGSKDSGI